MNSIEIEVIYTKRKKTISIQVLENKLRVLAPRGVLKTEIKDLIEKKRDWINQKIHSQTQFQCHKISYLDNLEDAVIFIFNQPYKVKMTLNQQRYSARINKDKLEISQQDKQMINHLKALLQIQEFLFNYAREVLLKKTNLYSEKMNLKFKSVIIKDYRSKWGSCFYDGRISYNFKIIQAPIEVIDYLVVHELSHLSHSNHQKSFWNLVNKFCPDYQSSRKWLNENQQKLLSLDIV